MTDARTSSSGRSRPSSPRASSDASSPFDAYATRLLIGWVGSLSLVLLVFSLPVSLVSVPQIGWEASAPERIQLSELRTETAPDEPEGRAVQASMDRYALVTRHETPPPVSDAATADDAPVGTAPDPEADGTAPETTRRSLATLATLGPSGTAPEIIGGLGALYLHIQYPQEARDKGIQGRLVLEFTVTPEGVTDHIRVLDPLHPLCDSAAVRALRTVRFAPGTRDGEKIPVRMTLPVRFELVPPSQTGSTKTADATRE